MAIALAVFGLVIAGLLVVGAGMFGRAPADDLPDPSPDVATPYLEGVQAAFRIEQAAWIAEQQIYAEAARHAAELPPSEVSRRA